MARRPYGSGSLTERGSGGAVTYYGSFWVRGRKVQFRIGRKRPPGSKRGMTKAQAERELRRRIEEARRRAPEPGMTLAAAAGLYLEHLKSVRRRKRTTLHDYRIIVDRHLLQFFGDTRLEAITPERVDEFLSAQRALGLADNTVRNHFAVLSGLCRFAVQSGWLGQNPADRVERPRTKRLTKRLSFLYPSELAPLLGMVEAGNLTQVYRVSLLTMAMAGLRLGEVLGLKREDIDFEARRIRVLDSYTRGEEDTPKGEYRSVPMSQALSNELQRHLAGSPQHANGLAFAHPIHGSHLDPSKLRKTYKRALRRAGLKPIRLHDLRHTFGTQCAAAGVPLRVLQEWLGHADPATTAIYVHYAPDAVRGSELIERAFKGFSSGAASDGKGKRDG